MNPSSRFEMRGRRTAWGIVVALAVQSPAQLFAAEVGQAACAAIAKHSFAEAIGAAVTIRSARIESSAGLPSYCAISAVIAPAVRVAMRLPSDGWNHRVLVAGCSNLCGIVDIESADDALARGYATATTDMGHDAASGLAWGGDPKAVEDFGHRATHVTTLLTKAVVLEYYRHTQKRAYFRGCSTGGRQGLIEAMRYPTDFDGIVAGAPATYPTVQIQWWDRRNNLRADGSEILDANALTLLHHAALASCDAADGLKDGLISNPLGCRVDLETLACGRAPPGSCLTPEQTKAARAFYSGPLAHGSRFTALGMAPGSELGVAGYIASRDGKPPDVDSVLTNFTQLMLHGSDWHTFPLDGTVARDDPTDSLPPLDTGQGLRAFAARGGHLLMYAGWIDPLVSPTVPIDIYRRNAAGLGAEDRATLRLFMLPGVAHCGGGDGPDAVDFLTAIEAWVEHGDAPQSLLSYKSASPPQPGEAGYRFPLPPRQVMYARPLYPFPAYARYRGRGTSTDPSSFEPAVP